MKYFRISERAHAYTTNLQRSYFDEFNVDCGVVIYRPVEAKNYICGIFLLEWTDDSDIIFNDNNVLYILKDVENIDFSEFMFEIDEFNNLKLVKSRNFIEIIQKIR